ncbi:MULTISPECIES: carbohydrate kinase family protein [unclassified Crossiella]|uniref:carbohydrate kinase family protein n=1 Tax=unclassified Crossiella TaxID=2620835 RepID=UPI001FFF1D2C|nr:MULTISPECIES: carbohydrate kinase family protein [unclassified Crossiella]MCK2239443.1 carbohydrate kinase family protein [Crossiella sp. S99.2]MCK2252138.1 carbohydrate kinase family protein [Crossiella sp. S99.1]
MPRVAVIGYASVDHAMETDPFLAATGTTLVRRRLSHPWPHLGGITYAAEGLTEAGHDVRAVTWVGQDAFGAAYTDRLASWGVDVSGVDQSGDRTPSNYLFYAPDEQVVTVYDPGEPVPQSLTETQRAVIADSDWVCLLVGPRPVTVEILDLLRPDQHLAWTVKDDPDAYPGGLVHRLLSTASVLTFSTRERLFLERAVAPRTLRDRTRAEALRAETQGSAGAQFWHNGNSGAVGTTAVDAVDTTGAGDVFFAAAVASMIEDPADPRRATEAGVAAATALLRCRKDSTEGKVC